MEREAEKARFTLLANSGGHSRPGSAFGSRLHDPVWHLFAVRHPERDRLQKFLGDAGVGTIIHYPVPPHLQNAYAELEFSADSFPRAERMANTLSSLPMGPHLSDQEADYIVSQLSAFYSQS